MDLKGIDVTVPADEPHQARNDLAWAISVGGIATIAFAALLVFTWHFAATLFLIFAGILLGVTLNAMTGMLGRVVAAAAYAEADNRLPDARRAAVGRDLPRRRHHRATGHRAEQYDQVATGQRQ